MSDGTNENNSNVFVYYIFFSCILFVYVSKTVLLSAFSFSADTSIMLKLNKTFVDQPLVME